MLYMYDHMTDHDTFKHFVCSKLRLLQVDTFVRHTIPYFYPVS